MGYQARQEVIGREVAARKETAAGKLTALLQVMQDTGLPATGFGAALGSDLRAVENLDAPATGSRGTGWRSPANRVYASGW